MPVQEEMQQTELVVQLEIQELQEAMVIRARMALQALVVLVV